MRKKDHIANNCDVIYIYNFYATSRLMREEFQSIVERLARDVNDGNPKIIAGDFNVLAENGAAEKRTQEGVYYFKLLLVSILF